MEKSRLISLSKKFSRTNPKLQDPKSVYSELVGTKEYEVFLSRLKGEDIALLCFLIPFAKITEDLEPIYDKIFVNLFTFSLIQIDEIEPEINCSSCDSEGYVVCAECDGDGEEGCYESDGEYETPMSENMYDTIIKNNKTFLMSDDMKNVSDIFNIYKINVNDVYFGALNKELSLSLSPYKKLEDNNLDSI